MFPISNTVAVFCSKLETLKSTFLLGTPKLPERGVVRGRSGINKSNGNPVAGFIVSIVPPGFIG